MARLIDLRTFTDKRGNLTVIEKVIPYEIRRIFYIYGVDHSVRGGHRHHKTIQAAVCVKGHCTIWSNDGSHSMEFVLTGPTSACFSNRRTGTKCMIFRRRDSDGIGLRVFFCRRRLHIRTLSGMIKSGPAT